MTNEEKIQEITEQIYKLTQERSVLCGDRQKEARRELIEIFKDPASYFDRPPEIMSCTAGVVSIQTRSQHIYDLVAKLSGLNPDYSITDDLGKRVWISNMSGTFQSDIGIINIHFDDIDSFSNFVSSRNLKIRCPDYYSKIAIAYQMLIDSNLLASGESL